MQTMPKRQTSARARLSAGDCGCGSASAGSYTTKGGRAGFSFGVLERPRYRARQLMTPEIMQLEADYFRDRMRRHNMFLHGWGVVCGALVCVVPRKARSRSDPRFERQVSSLRSNNPYQATAVAVNGNGTGAANADGEFEPWLVRVQPGYILGPYGDEILIDKPVDVPLRGSGMSGCGADSGDDLTDPWCSEVFVDRRTEPFYIAVRYRECPVLPVRGQPSGCGCDDEPCEYSRYRDSFEIGFLDCCPDDQNRDNSSPDLDDDRNPVCPDCPTSPWVVLAQVTVNADGVVTLIDNCTCRRVMVTTRDLWFGCNGTDCDQPERTEPETEPETEPRPTPRPIPGRPGIDGSITTKPTPGDSTGETPAPGDSTGVKPAPTPGDATAEPPAGDGTGGPKPDRPRPPRRRIGN